MSYRPENVRTFGVPLVRSAPKRRTSSGRVSASPPGPISMLSCTYSAAVGLAFLQQSKDRGSAHLCYELCHGWFVHDIEYDRWAISRQEAYWECEASLGREG